MEIAIPRVSLKDGGGKDGMVRDDVFGSPRTFDAGLCPK